MELTGKRIIVTGAARGLGKYMATACIRSGAQVLRTATGRYALEETVGESQAAAAAPVAWTGFGDQMRVPVGGMPAPKQQ